MTTRGLREPRDLRNGKEVDSAVNAPPRPRNARETAENSPAAEAMGIRTARDSRYDRAERDSVESVPMSVPPRNRWQVLMVEYELLDSYVAQINQRVWMSGLVLIGLSLLGLAYMAAMKPGLMDTLNVISLVGGVGSLLALSWWVLLRRLFIAQRVAEYRRNEIERELGLRTGLYVTFLRQHRSLGSTREASLARRLAEGDIGLETDLRDLALSPQVKSAMPGFLSDRLVWSLVPWLLIAAWAGLYFLKL